MGNFDINTQKKMPNQKIAERVRTPREFMFEFLEKNFCHGNHFLPDFNSSNSLGLIMSHRFWSFSFWFFFARASLSIIVASRSLT